MSKPAASEFAKYAALPMWIGIPYEQWDCQHYVEQMLKGVNAYKNYKGSNDMWRHALSWKGTVSEAITRHGGALKPGTWLFTIKHDGGERERGYKDDEGNAAHVGIYVGEHDGYNVVHSTTGGVQRDKLTSKRWTHAGESIHLDYGDYQVLSALDVINLLEEAIRILKEGNDYESE